MPEKTQVNYDNPLKKNKKICASSHVCIFCINDCFDCKESPEPLRGIFYQMDHI